MEYEQMEQYLNYVAQMNPKYVSKRTAQDLINQAKKIKRGQDEE